MPKVTSSAKHFTATSFQESTLSSIWSCYFVFSSLGKIKPVRVRPFYPLSFLFKHNTNITELPVTRNWAVLHWRSFCLLLWRTCSFSRNFCSNEAISRKKSNKNSTQQMRKTTEKISFRSLLQGSVIYVEIRKPYA